MKCLLKLISLSALCIYFSVSAQSNPCEVDPGQCKQTEDIFGVWELKEVTLNSDPELGLGPFPVNITIEATESDKGKVTLQLRAQSKTKEYPFSKTEFIEQKKLQVYDKPDITSEFTPYTLEEIAIISYSEGVLRVNLKWTKKNENDEIEWTVPGSYTFTLDGDLLIFTRTNDKDVPEENRVQTTFEAHYQKSQVTE